MLGRNLQPPSDTSGMKQNANPTTLAEATKTKYHSSYPAHGGYEKVWLLTFYLLSLLPKTPNPKSFEAEEDSAI